MEVDESLRRLQTNYIDIYQVHWPDTSVPMQETAEAMERLYRSGKIRAIGVSNFSPEQMEEFRKLAPLHSSQPPYNLFERQIEGDVLPYARKNNISILAYGSLCRGLLSGKMKPDTKFEGDDLRKIDPKFQSPRYSQYLRAVQALDAFAHENYGKRVIELAVRWVLDQPGVTVALWGARRPEQLSPVENITGWKLDAGAIQAIGKIVNEAVTSPIGPEFMAPATRQPVAREQ
jgi:aryl-alcohol dehydrogenase-like predicted oxidoreductase